MRAFAICDVLEHVDGKDSRKNMDTPAITPSTSVYMDRCTTVTRHEQQHHS